MAVRGVWEPARALAISLYVELSSASDEDTFTVAFADRARRIDPAELDVLRVQEQPWGSNYEDGLKLAQTLLATARPPHHVFLVAEGEPTAYCQENDEVVFSWPPTPKTLERTLAQIQECRRGGIQLCMLGLTTIPYVRKWIQGVIEAVDGVALLLDGNFDVTVVDYRRDAADIDARVIAEAAIARSRLN